MRRADAGITAFSSKNNPASGELHVASLRRPLYKRWLTRDQRNGRGYRTVDSTSKTEFGPDLNARETGVTPVTSALPAGLSSARVLAAVLDRAIQPFVASDLEGKITHVNPAFAELTGYAAVELVGRSLAEITPPKLREAQARAVGKVRSTVKSRSLSSPRPSNPSAARCSATGFSAARSSVTGSTAAG